MNKEEILDSFFKGELSQSDMQGYLDRGEIVDSDIQAFSHLISSLEESDSAKTREYLQNLETPSNSRRNWKMLIVSLFGILLVVFLSFYFFNKEKPISNDKIDLNKYAFLYPSESNSRSNDKTNDPISEVYLQANTYYANSEYKEFENLFEENKDSFSTVESLQLQYVSSLIALNKYDKLLNLENQINCNTSDCFQNMEWYKVLSLIATNKIDEAKLILQGIQNNPDHIFYKDSKELFKEIN